MRQRTKPSGQGVERRPLALDKEERGAIETFAESAQSLAQLALVGDDEARGGGGRGGANVCGEIAKRRVLLVSDRGDDRDRRVRDGADKALVAEGEQVLEATAPAREHEDVDFGLAGDVGQRSRERGSGAWTLDIGLRHEEPRRRKARRHRRDEIALGGGLVPGHERDPTGEARQRALARWREEALVGESALDALDAGEHGSEAERLDRQRAQAELAASGEELRAAEHVHGHAVGELEAQGVE